SANWWNASLFQACKSPRLGGRRTSGPGSARILGTAACLPVRVFRLSQKRAHVGVFGKQRQVFLHRLTCVVMRVDSNVQRREHTVEPGRVRIGLQAVLDGGDGVLGLARLYLKRRKQFEILRIG